MSETGRHVWTDALQKERNVSPLILYSWMAERKTKILHSMLSYRLLRTTKILGKQQERWMTFNEQNSITILLSFLYITIAILSMCNAYIKWCYWICNLRTF